MDKIKEITKEQIENYLYNWNYYEGNVMKQEKIIEALKAEKEMQYERYPSLRCENIRVRNSVKKNDGITNYVINLIETYDYKIEYYKNKLINEHYNFIMVREAISRLDGVGKKIIRLKYFESRRGKYLYEELNYTKRGYYAAQKRVLNTIIKWANRNQM